MIQSVQILLEMVTSLCKLGTPVDQYQSKLDSHYGLV